MDGAIREPIRVRLETPAPRESRANRGSPARTERLAIRGPRGRLDNRVGPAPKAGKEAVERRDSLDSKATLEGWVRTASRENRGSRVRRGTMVRRETRGRRGWMGTMDRREIKVRRETLEMPLQGTREVPEVKDRRERTRLPAGVRGIQPDGPMA